MRCVQDLQQEIESLQQRLRENSENEARPNPAHDQALSDLMHQKLAVEAQVEHLAALAAER